MEANPHINEQPQPGFTGTVKLFVGKGWRTTIPKELREALAIQEHSVVDVDLKDGEVVKVERLPTLEELAGSIELDLGGKDLEEVIREAKEEHRDKRWARINSYE